MHLMGLVALGYMWCRIVEAASARLAVNEAAGRLRDQLVTGRFFVGRFFVETEAAGTALHLGRIRRGAGNVMELPAEAL